MLLAANQRLYTLREQRAVADERPFPTTAVSASSNPTIVTAVAALPAHLGWGSVVVSQVVRGAGEQGSRGENARLQHCRR